MKTKFKISELKISTRIMVFAMATLAFNCSKDDLAEQDLLVASKVVTVSPSSSVIFQAENSDAQSGTRTENTTDSGGGRNVGYIDTGDYLEYDLSIANSGSYKIDFRVASRSNGAKFDFYQGSTKLNNVNKAATGGWQNWITTSKTVNLSSGNSTLRLVATGRGWNINWIRITPVDVDENTGGGSSNLALGKSTSQSSTAYGGSSGRAVDGNTSGVWNQNSVTHTSNTLRPWWQVQLGGNSQIGQIKIWNRTNCCTSRLSNFDVFVYNAAGSQVYKTTITSTPSPSVTINTGGVTGSRVRIKLKGTNPLSLAEVQVFGESDGGSGDGGGDGGNNGTAAGILNGLTNWKFNGYTGNLNLGSSDNGLDYADSASKSDNTDWLFPSNGYAYFKTYPGNPTSGGSSNPRSELRELTSNGSGNINWNGTTNTEHSMKWRVRVDDLPPSGKLAFGQIHAQSGSPFDDVIRVQVQGSSGQNSGNVTLRILGYASEELLGGGQSISNFTFNMDTEYYFELTMRNRIVRLYALNSSGSRVSTLFTSGSINSTGNYFKAGCYLQSTSSSDSGSNVFGLVGIKSISVSH